MTLLFRVGRPALGVVACLALRTRALEAQRVNAPVACAGQRVTNVSVTTRPPFHGKTGKWWEIPVRAASRLHATTRPAVVRRFLLLQIGDKCLERLRVESERVLRSQPFIADARVNIVDDGEGGVIVAAETIDEFTPIIAGRTSGVNITGLRLGDGNVLGSGRRIDAEWRKNDLRDTYGIHVTDYQFAGQPWIVDLAAVRGDAAEHEVFADVYRPFYVDDQRFAWRSRFSDGKQLFGLLRGADVPDALFDIQRKFLDIGGVVRVGVPGRLSLFGFSFSREVDTPGLPPRIDPLVDYNALLGQFHPRNNARINALWGVRNIYYRKAERLDVLNAKQDVRYGFQFGSIFGRSISVLGTTDDDIIVGSDIYLGIGRGPTFFRLQGRGEGRQNYDEDKWDGILVSASAALYQRLSNHHTAVLSADFGAGWRQRIPLQLSLGDEEGGVRGFKDSQYAGARRVVVRVEERWYIGGVFDQADIGLSPFVDAGYLRAGDAPYGVNTPFKVGAGLGLLAAAPRGSQRTWRLDLAFAATKDPTAKWELRLSNIDARRQGFSEPSEIARAREQAVPASVFSWPY
ncbi:MAG: hypothetical protein M3081_09735 [Gemmatimonadota bacterium]|nr:hypothetical protein [Gemmatimonadota bacterium]